MQVLVAIVTGVASGLYIFGPYFRSRAVEQSINTVPSMTSSSGTSQTDDLDSANDSPKANS